MVIWVGNVTELQAVERYYYVEAANLEEAQEKVEKGETIHEVTFKNSGVQQREVFNVQSYEELDCARCEKTIPFREDVSTPSGSMCKPCAAQYEADNPEDW